MSERAQLLSVLSRVRRRLRALAALQGAVVGGLLALVAVAFAVVVWRWRGQPLLLEYAAAAAAGLSGAMAAAFALRPVALRRCARALDQSLGGHDRVLSALAFTAAAETDFTRAAIGDAARRAREVAPGRAAPLRRPRGLFALGAAALLVLAAGLSPVPAPAGSGVASARPARRLEPPLRLDPATLEAEREEARRAERAAAARHDDELGELARALGDAVRQLTEGTVPRGEALDRLAELQKRADELADDSEELARGLERTATTMKESALTKAVGEAMGAKDAAATEKALAQLADRAAQATASERRSLADSLAEAAGQAAGAATSSGAPGREQAASSDATDEPQRRLARSRSANPAGSGEAGGGARSGERRLQRLRRELEELAAACREDPERCRRKLQDSARELPRMENEARSSESRRRLSAAVRQLRERLRREAAGGRDSQRQRPGQGQGQGDEQRFSRAARGKATPGGNKGQGAPGEESAAMSEDVGAGDDLELESAGEGDSEAASEGEGAGAMSAEAEGAGAGQGNQGDDGKAGAADGQGIGNQAGGEPLGRRDGQATRGREREAPVKSGAGPTRAQVIEAAAARGFARGGYRGVFQDYEAVVEESLDASAVPPGRRYVVRRYFQLIRPRAAPAAARGKAKQPERSQSR